MGFRSFIPPAPLSQIDTRPVLDLAETIPNGETLIFTIAARELDGANALMVVHDTPLSSSLTRLRVFAESQATSGVVALEREWGEWPSNRTFVVRSWRLPVVLPTYGGDVRLTLNNPRSGFGHPFQMKAYALRGADLTPRPASTGFFYPEPPPPSIPNPDTEEGIMIPTIPPEYRQARIEGASEGGDGTWEINVERHLQGAITPDRDPALFDSFVTNKTVEITKDMGGEVRGGVTINTAGVQAMGVSLLATLLDGDSPDRLGFTITLLP